MSIGLLHRKPKSRRRFPQAQVAVIYTGSCDLDGACQAAVLWPGGTFDGFIVQGCAGYIIRKRRGYIHMLIPSNATALCEDLAVAHFQNWCLTECPE